MPVYEQSLFDKVYEWCVKSVTGIAEFSNKQNKKAVNIEN